MMLQIGTTTSSDPWAILLNLAFLIFLVVSMLYGTKIQAYRSLKVLEGALVKLEKWNLKCKNILVKKIQKLSQSTKTPKEIEAMLDEFMGFVEIMPTTLDPAGIVPKIDFLVDVRDERFKEESQHLAPQATREQQLSLENLIEASMAVDQIFKVVRHFMILAKKTKSYILAMQVEMQMGLIMGMAKAYKDAAKAFDEASPIGDALGPMVAAYFIREVNGPEGAPAEEPVRETSVQRVNFESREILVVRAKGPGGCVGKPGELIKRLIDEEGEQVSRVIMVDAGLKLEGEKTGTVVTGVGAAIGGIGSEKYFIEEASTTKKIPVDAFICRESLEDAITTMKKAIAKAVPTIVNFIKETIRIRTAEGSKVILAGIGNTIGVGL
ncbi:MAG TPA: DUF1512 family protein [Candidatus Lokiarchaeia archaeon]|nr:DUF1512 family protein [Candidatus Lokiarchaeia archaeon]